MSDLNQALLSVQRDMPAVDRDGVNPHFNSRFVTLGNLISTVRPLLNEAGIVFTQFPSHDGEGKPTLVTALIHAESGERMEYAATLMPVKSDPQAQGSAITYMRRYALASALGIVDQEDDDGNAGSAREPAAQPKADEATKGQKAAITRRCNELRISDEHKPLLITWAGGEAKKPLTKEQATAIVDLLKAEKFEEVWKNAGLPNPKAHDPAKSEQTLEDAVLAPGGAEALGLTEADE